MPITPPAGGTTPDGVAYTYAANDASVGDLDGDGQLEIVLKWDPTNAKDNSQSGYTGNVYVDGIELNGTRMWRIDLGRNIRAGAHYTQFQVYDYDGDGCAEVAMKTADGTVDGKGTVYRQCHRRLPQLRPATCSPAGNTSASSPGPAAACGAPRPTTRRAAPSPTGATPTATGSTGSWPAPPTWTAHRPSLIMARGYYTRTVITAWNFRDGALTQLWTFDSNTAGDRSTTGQGNHQLSIADVDADGKDEIVYGAMCIDDNGSVLWTTELGHGDAMHVGDLIPSRPALRSSRSRRTPRKPGSVMLDAKTGAIIWSDGLRCATTAAVWPATSTPAAPAPRPGRPLTPACAAPPAPRRPQAQLANFLAWWDADPVRELLDATKIDKYGTGGHPPAHRQRRALQQRHQVDPVAVRRHPRRLARGGHLADHRQHGAADLQQPVPDDPQRFPPCCTTPSTAWRSPGRTPPTTSRRIPSFFIGDGMASTISQPSVYTP